MESRPIDKKNSEPLDSLFIPLREASQQTEFFKKRLSAKEKNKSCLVVEEMDKVSLPSLSTAHSN